MTAASRVGALAGLLVLAWASPARPQAECAFTPCAPGAAAAQTIEGLWARAALAHQIKGEFVDALQTFTRAQSGVVGDEGGALSASLDAMRRALGRWDRVLADMDTAAAGMRRTDEVHVAIATAYLDRDRPTDALRELASAERRNPARADVYSLQAHAYDRLGRDDDAARVLARAAALLPDDPTLAYRLARHAQRAGLADEAGAARQRFTALVGTPVPRPAPAAEPFERIGLLRQAGGVAPVFPIERYAEGYAALAAGDYGAAMSRLARAVGRDPLAAVERRAQPLVARAGEALRRGEVAAAIDQLREMSSAYPSSIGHRMLGLAYDLAAQPLRAIEQFETAVRVDPQDERAHIALADALRAAGRDVDAEQHLLAAAAGFEASGEIAFRLAGLYETQGRHPEAAAALQASLARHPIVGRDHLTQRLAGIRANQAEFARAAELHAERVALNPNNPDAHRQLAEIYFLQGDDAAALAEFSAAAFLDGADARPLIGAGQVHLRAQRYADAAEALSRAFALGADDAQTRYALGFALTRLGRGEEGRAHIAASQQLQHDGIAAGRAAFEWRAVRRQMDAALAAGDAPGAILSFERLAAGGQITDLSPDDHEGLAAAYDAIGQAANAARHRAAAEQVREQRQRRRLEEVVGRGAR